MVFGRTVVDFSLFASAIPAAFNCLTDMTAQLFCCDATQPYRSRFLDHESKFTAFLAWTKRHDSMINSQAMSNSAPYAIQLVRQVNYGPLESIRYFVPSDSTDDFVEVDEDQLVQANFEKVNSYKNFRCTVHNKFFELNLYQKNAVNSHHWRATIARPARDIDLHLRSRPPAPECHLTGSPLAALKPSPKVSRAGVVDVSGHIESISLGKSTKDTAEEKYEGNFSRSSDTEPIALSGLSNLGSVVRPRDASALPADTRVEETQSDGQTHEKEKCFSYESDDDYNRFGSHEYDDYDEPLKDLTACDKECGYCGRCSY